MMKTDKEWGTTELLLADLTTSIHRIEIERGGFCSWHLHEEKVNAFTVVSGELEVQWTEDIGAGHYGRTLRAGDAMAVPPGRKHRFVALTPVVAIETYWPSPGKVNREDDIVRFSSGGVNPC